MNTTQAIEHFKELLAIDKNALDDELEQHPVIYEQIGEFLAMAIAERDAEKEALSRTTAKAAAEMRSAPAEKKISEAQITSMLPQNDSVIAATNAHLEAKALADQLSALKDAWDMRGKMLRELCHLYTAGYWQRAPIKEGKKDLDKADLSSIREELAGKRAADTDEVFDEEPPIETTEEENAPKKRRRKAKVEEPEEVEEDAVDEDEADPEPEEQPRRSRRRRAAEKEVEELDAEEEVEEDESEAEDEPAEEKPRRRRRKAEPVEEDDSDGEPEEEEEEKPRRSRRRRNAEPEAETEEESTGSDEEETNEDTGRRRRVRRRRQ